MIEVRTYKKYFSCKDFKWTVFEWTFSLIIYLYSSVSLYIVNFSVMFSFFTRNLYDNYVTLFAHATLRFTHGRSSQKH